MTWRGLRRAPAGRGSRIGARAGSRPATSTRWPRRWRGVRGRGRPRARLRRTRRRPAQKLATSKLAGAWAPFKTCCAIETGVEPPLQRFSRVSGRVVLEAARCFARGSNNASVFGVGWMTRIEQQASHRDGRTVQRRPVERQAERQREQEEHDLAAAFEELRHAGEPYHDARREGRQGPAVRRV
jgi:hypothetical protein